MSYDYLSKYKEWYAWKKKEEKLHKELNVPQQMIDELRKYDYEQFNAERRYHRRHILMEDNYFINQPTKNKELSYNIYELLDDIENEALYEYLKHVDSEVIKIISLKLQGYSVKEISNIMGMSIDRIYNRIKKIKKVLK